MNYRIPVNVVNVPANMVIDGIDPPVVNAKFSGPRRAFYLFDPRKISLTVDVSMAEMGRRTFNITEQDIRYPKELTLQDLSPSTLKLSVKRADGTDPSSLLSSKFRVRGSVNSEPTVNLEH